MCVIVVSKSSQADLRTLRQCEAANTHGGGCAWVQGGLVRWRKGLTAEEVFDLLQDKPFPQVAHFRIASVGPVNDPLCHPFNIHPSNGDELEGMTRGAVMFHNGTVKGWQFYAKLAGVLPSGSDSKTIARIVSIRGTEILGNIAEITGSRFVVLHGNGRIETFGEFHDRGGHRFSNTVFSRDFHAIRIAAEENNERREREKDFRLWYTS